MENQSTGNAELADRYSRKRALAMIAVGAMFVFQQVSFMGQGAASRTVDYVRIGGWAAMSGAILLVLLTGGAFLRKPAMRALMNDEVSRANRHSAIVRGFTVAMVLSIVLYLVSEFREVHARQAIHLIVTFGLASALIRFGKLERKSLG